ncbi:glycosyl hydrolase family 95 catalytic domain-containing protein [Kribbella sp. NPDC054772]
MVSWKQQAGEWRDEAYLGAVSHAMPDTALLGNGDVGVTSGGKAGVKAFSLSKGDFWNAHPEPMPAVLGGVALMSGSWSGFHETQHIVEPRIVSELGTSLWMETWLAAERNVLVTEITSRDEGAIELTVRVWPGPWREKDAQAAYRNACGASGDVLWASRATAEGGAWVSRAAFATRLLGAADAGRPQVVGAGIEQRFTVAAGATMWVVSCVAGGGRNAVEPELDAVAEVTALGVRDLERVRRDSRRWWETYWQQSSADLGDDLIERFYYAAQYFLGASSRPGKVAPGLHGIWTTTDFPVFHGDYHLNYNAQAPYYGVYSSNRPELVLPFFQVIEDYLPEARRRAREDLARVQLEYIATRFPDGGLPGGALFPVGLGPYGSTTDDVYLNQVSNVLFTASQYVEYFDHTQDTEFLRDTAYPFLRDAAEFFAHYLEWDEGRYRLWSGPHEGSWGSNSSVDIALLRQLLTLLVEHEADLTAVDPKWRHMLEHLPSTPTAVVNGRIVYALADAGTLKGDDPRDIRPGDNTVNLEFIHPAGQNADRQIAIDTLDAMDSWDQENSFPKVFTQAVRGGYPAEKLLDILRSVIERRQARNLRITDGWHGIEKSGATEAINSMLVATRNDVVSVFPHWPTTRDASFTTLRQKGGFLISAAQQDGRVTFVEIVSLAGRPLQVRNPWPEAAVLRNGQPEPGSDQEILRFDTDPGDRIELTAVNQLTSTEAS